MGKTRDLFKKIRDNKGTFHAKMGTVKERNGMDLIEAEDIKKRWQEYTEELYRKDLYDPDNHDGVIIHLEPDILECEVMWTLGNITANNARGGDGATVELFQILKDDAVKVLHSICQQIWKTQQWPQDWKRSVFSSLEFHSNPSAKSVVTTSLDAFLFSSIIFRYAFILEYNMLCWVCVGSIFSFMIFPETKK